MEKRLDLRVNCSDAVFHQIAAASGGDVRKAVSAVELLCRAAVPEKGAVELRGEDAAQAAQRSAMRYDRDGDDHYDLLSALQKSIRGSDPDAAVHYLARLPGSRGYALALPPAAGHRRRGCGPCLSPRPSWW